MLFLRRGRTARWRCDAETMRNTTKNSAPSTALLTGATSGHKPRGSFLLRSLALPVPLSWEPVPSCCTAQAQPWRPHQNPPNQPPPLLPPLRPRPPRPPPLLLKPEHPPNLLRRPASQRQHRAWWTPVPGGSGRGHESRWKHRRRRRRQGKPGNRRSPAPRRRSPDRIQHQNLHRRGHPAAGPRRQNHPRRTHRNLPPRPNPRGRHRQLENHRPPAATAHKRTTRIQRQDRL